MGKVHNKIHEAFYKLYNYNFRERSREIRIEAMITEVSVSLLILEFGCIISKSKL